MKYWVLWLISGLTSLFVGLYALANPLAASLAATVITGWLFTLVGILILISAFGDQGWGGRLLTIVLGFFVFLAGVNLIAEPLSGVLSLTFLTGIFLLILGLARIVLRLSLEVARLRWVLIIAGALSLLLGSMVLANFPRSAAVVLSLFLAIDLISNGITLIVLSLSRRSS
ncbi:acid-resistance membrane protein [Roseovarius gaetbuli]|uniref:Acid-resistance membrane protein n=1 Tax=Roseovarius gaetbuli TaxID=1356575 RepID=A0A1X6ZTU6_9RHOB|nr:DUF308 domain-containing protein [Roseovarius gaetbuli]SLN59424.1 acid-resistance membrane protein [Roseovarius gaetbuli]